jgi:hypothetical protein
MVIIAVGAAGFVIRRRVASEGSRVRPPEPVPPQPLVDVQPSPTEAGQ